MTLGNLYQTEVEKTKNKTELLPKKEVSKSEKSTKRPWWATFANADSSKKTIATADEATTEAAETVTLGNNIQTTTRTSTIDNTIKDASFDFNMPPLRNRISTNTIGKLITVSGITTTK